MKHQRGFTEIRYADMLLPYRWPAFNVARGDHYIARAERRLQERDPADALHLLRAGLARSPANPRGRALLANLYQLARRPDLARETLLGGLPLLEQNHAYLVTVLNFLSEQQDDAAIIRLSTSLLERSPAPPLRTLLSAHAATAAYHRGHYDQAENFLSQPGLAATTEAVLLQARIDWNRGLPDLAVARLTDRLHQEPHNLSLNKLLADFYRKLGRTTEWQTSVVAQLAADPLAPGPRLEYLRFLHEQGDVDRLTRLADEFLTHFAHDHAALLQLAGLAAETGQPILARRVQASLPPDEEAAVAAALLVAESHLVAGEHAEALSLLAELERTHPQSPARIANASHSLQAIALHGRGRTDEARLHLEQFLAQSDIRADTLVTVAQRLADVGARESAQTVLRRAIERDPLNQAALALLLEFTLETDDPAALVAHLERYLRLRQPSRDLLTRIRDRLGSDRHLFFEPQPRTLAALSRALSAAER